MNRELSNDEAADVGLAGNTPDPEKWHGGKPPHAGWWNASRTRNHRTWRWYDGRQWSKAFTVSEIDSKGTLDRWCGAPTEEDVADKAYKDRSKPIRWSYHYPKNARVERKAP